MVWFRSAYSFFLRLMLLSILLALPCRMVLAEETNESKSLPVNSADTKEPNAKEPSVKRLTINGITILFTGDNEAVIETGGQSVKINTANQSAVEMNQLTDSPSANTKEAKDAKEPAAEKDKPK